MGTLLWDTEVSTVNTIELTVHEQAIERNKNVQQTVKRCFHLVIQQILFGTYCGSCPRDIFMNKTEAIPVLVELTLPLGKTNSK